MSLRDDLKTLFVAAPVSLTFGTSLFSGLKAVLPKDAGTSPYLTMVMTGGSGPAFIQNKKEPARRFPGAALTAYARTTGAAEALALLAYNACVGVVNARIGSGGFYLRIRPLQEPFELPAAADGLARWRFNVVAEMRS